MTLREWLRRRIAQAEGTAVAGRYHERRLLAAERARTLRSVLVELERAGLDFAPRWNCKSRRR